MAFNDPTRWYVVANRVHAGLYVETSEKTFQPILHLFDQQARMSEKNLDSDAPGSSVSSAGSGSIHHSLDRRFHTREQHAIQFARRISEHLEQMRQQGRYDELVLVAEPKFLGLLKSSLSKGTLSRVKDELPSELNAPSDQLLRGQILQGIRNKNQRKEKSYESRSSI